MNRRMSCVACERAADRCDSGKRSFLVLACVIALLVFTLYVAYGSNAADGDVSVAQDNASVAQDDSLAAQGGALVSQNSAPTVQEETSSAQVDGLVSQESVSTALESTPVD